MTPGTFRGMATDPTAIVDRYLEYVEDDSTIRDEQAIEAAENKVHAAPTAAEKLIALSELERLQEGDPSELIAEFVSVARQWGRDHQITLGAWKAMNVPDDVLAQARITGYAQSDPSALSGPRRTRVSAETVKAAIPSGEFTIGELADASGATAATVRNVVAELLRTRVVEEIGERPSERGRAAKLYSKV